MKYQMLFSVKYALIELLWLFYPVWHVKVYGVVPSGVNHDLEHPVNDCCLTYCHSDVSGFSPSDVHVIIFWQFVSDGTLNDEDQADDEDEDADDDTDDDDDH